MITKPNYTNLKRVYEAVREVIPEGELGLVGGCVRDTVLGLEPKDYDLNTNLTPDRVEELVKKAGRHAYTIGKKYGTIGFKVKVMFENIYDCPAGFFTAQWQMMERWVYVEITTYRDEKYDPNSRKPVVTFGTDLRQDILRRDFTINSLWYGSLDPNGEPELLDLLAGRLHLADGLIKACRDPKKMIDDDPLRILRAVRFSAKYQFTIEQNLYGVCKKNREKLWKVAIERMTVEYDKILTCRTSEIGLRELNDMGITQMLLPEVAEAPFKLIKMGDPDLAWQSYLRYIGGHVRESDGAWIFDKPRHDFLCDGIAARFKFSNKRAEIIKGGKECLNGAKAENKSKS